MYERHINLWKVYMYRLKTFCNDTEMVFHHSLQPKTVFSLMNLILQFLVTKIGEKQTQYHFQEV